MCRCEGTSVYRGCENGSHGVILCSAIPMETGIRRCRNILVMLLLLGYFSSYNEAAFNPESFQRKLVALYKVLDYIHNKSQQMNVDVTFGITLTEANLAAALSHKNMRHVENKFFNTLKKLIVLCDLTRKKLMDIVVPKNDNELLLNSVVNDPNMWIRPIQWSKILSNTKLTSSQPLNFIKVVKSIWYGTPNETESDRRLFEIVSSTLNGGCRLTEGCIETLVRNDNPMGYPLTHRLLIVQLAKALGCKENKSAPFAYLIPAYCAMILRDLSNLETWNFPSVAPDLATEQIVLCGMEGYYEFVDKHYENLILSWLHQSGCFSAFGFPKKGQFTRRSSSATDFGCDNHATVLGAASLALFIRENIENAFDRRFI